ncbi:MAG TPA: diacylglycerol kinase family protein [Terriglobia bacterium]|nr:diacylglycerol kinase family protein [Terriglobia bacterium]
MVANLIPQLLDFLLSAFGHGNLAFLGAVRLLTGTKAAEKLYRDAGETACLDIALRGLLASLFKEDLGLANVAAGSSGGAILHCLLSRLADLSLKNVTLIYNPIAGRRPKRREKQARQAARVLEASGMTVKLSPTSGPSEATSLARAAVTERCDLVLVCGGDGTVNEVINGLVPGNTPLGILPGGTANIIAKELRLPHHPVRAAKDLARWTPRRIGVGMATWTHPVEASTPADAARGTPHHRYFMSVAGIGFDAYVVYRLSTTFKLSLGVAAYIIEAVRQAWRYSFPAFSCQAGGRHMEGTFAVAQRSSHYAGWLPLAPKASISRDTFSLCVFKSRNRLRYFLYAASVLARQHLRLKDVELVEDKAIDCEGVNPAKPIYFELDGELVGQLPARFEVIPDALTLLAP